MYSHLIETALWIIAGLCAFATLYPYLIYPLLLWMHPAKPVRTSTVDAQLGGEFALLFCAYNEASSLPAKIDNLRQLRAAYPQLEILAYDDCSSDSTAQTLEQADLAIRVIRGKGRTGKAHGMKLLASLTERDFLIFTDANVVLDVDALPHLRSSYSDSTVGGVCGLLKYVDSGGTPTAHAGGLYWELEERIKSAESRTGSVMGADGSIFSIRRVLYPEFPDTVLDDLTVSMSVVFQRFRLIKAPQVIAREQLVASRKDDFRRRIRIATRSYHTYMWLKPNLKRLPLEERWRFWSHRQMRWYGGFFLISGFLSGLAALCLSTSWTTGLFVTAVAGAIIALGSVFSLGPISASIHVLFSILLTGLGVIRGLRGGTVTTWKPPTR